MSPCRQVFDAITLVDYVHSSTADNPHFGVKFQTTPPLPRRGPLQNLGRRTEVGVMSAAAATAATARFGRDSARNPERNSVPETPSTP